MQISKTDNHTLLVALSGELDHHIASKVRREIDQAISNDINNIIFDFSQLSFMDSSGIGMIMARYKKIKQKGGNFIIISPKPQVSRILEMSGILGIIKTEKSLKQAIKKCKG